MCHEVWPEEGELLSVHPGGQSQAGILSKGRDDHGEDQRYQDEAGRKDNLQSHSHKSNNMRRCIQTILAKKKTFPHWTSTLCVSKLPGIQIGNVAMIHKFKPIYFKRIRKFNCRHFAHPCIPVLGISIRYLRQKVFLASCSVVEPLHKQSVELLQGQSNTFHLPGAPSCTAVRGVVGAIHPIVFCVQPENSKHYFKIIAMENQTTEWDV